ncbi:unnamed protein product [Timema podura]|uniref:Uncharacterized protein n=1 Tax=Timema podura TaxID=61482 RepID=A0ABN7NZ96_TIMPD|nr:unnamed protein product [Timema podura]
MHSSLITSSSKAGCRAPWPVDNLSNVCYHLPTDVSGDYSKAAVSALSLMMVERLQEVPAELGHLPSIRMINLSENLLCNLPVSILKLSHLTALWLSNNQNTPLVTLHKEIDKETGQTVCVNFMLPQTIQDRYVALPKGTANNSNEEHTPRSHPHIWFATEATEDKSCGLLRAPTPYPKELRAMSKHVRNMQQSSKRASREAGGVASHCLCATVMTQPLLNLCGKTYDEAGDISEHMKGAQSLKIEKQPLAHCVHCSAHYSIVMKDSYNSSLVLKNTMESTS